MAQSVAKLGKLKTKTIRNRQGAISYRRGQGGKSQGENRVGKAKWEENTEMDSK